MKQSITTLSKYLSLVLRHKPEEIGIELDEHGWTDVELLIQKMNDGGTRITLELLGEIVRTDNKQRYSFSDDRKKIRANQGHSVAVELGYVSRTPPEILFHGTGLKSVASILASGLDKRSRHHVHLSGDIETALIVGRRHGVPFVFEILAGQMHQQGFEFFLTDNGVWLTEHVPAEFLKEHQS